MTKVDVILMTVWLLPEVTTVSTEMVDAILMMTVWLLLEVTTVSTEKVDAILMTVVVAGSDHCVNRIG